MNIYKLCGIIILVSILLGILAGYTSAQSGDNMSYKVLDVTLGFAGGVCLKEMLHQDYKQSIIEIAVISAFKEIGDSMYRDGVFGKPDSGHAFWDKRGGDWTDIARRTAGAAVVPFVFEIRGWTVKVGVIR